MRAATTATASDAAWRGAISHGDPQLRWDGRRHLPTGRRGWGGGREMVADGVMERFGVKQVYGMHNAPGVPVGVFAIRKVR